MINKLNHNVEMRPFTVRIFFVNTIYFYKNGLIIRPMLYFVINKNATLPYLEIEPVHDGRNTYKKLYLALQAASVTFTMTNQETGIKKIANAPCDIVSCEDCGCEERLKIQYRWKKRDTAESGIFIGQFNIKFNDTITMDGVTFPEGELIAPIAEELQICINDGSIKR